MEENKEFNAELQEEVVEEATLEAEETTEEIAEELAESEDETEADEECECEECKEDKSKAFVIASILVSLVIVVLSFITSMSANKYNAMGYVDIYGQTVQDMADAEGCSLEDFLAMYQLPADMPGDTNSNAAENMIPAGVVAEEMTQYLGQIKSFVGMNENVSNFELFKLISGMPAEVTESMPIGEAKGLVKLKYIVKDETELEEFKAMYGFDESVTLETEFKEIRNIVDNYTKKKYEEQVALQEQLMQQIQQAAEENTSEESEVVPAE